MSEIIVVDDIYEDEPLVIVFSPYVEVTNDQGN